MVGSVVATVVASVVSRPGGELSGPGSRAGPGGATVAEAEGRTFPRPDGTYRRGAEQMRRRTHAEGAGTMAGKIIETIGCPADMPGIAQSPAPCSATARTAGAAARPPSGKRPAGPDRGTRDGRAGERHPPRPVPPPAVAPPSPSAEETDMTHPLTSAPEAALPTWRRARPQRRPSPLPARPPARRGGARRRAAPPPPETGR